MKMGLFPGCSLEGSAREYAESLHAIAPLLEWELAELSDWNCCGATAAHCLNHTLALALPARILALAENAGVEELLVPCSACYSRLAATRQEIQQNAELRPKINQIIEMELAGRTNVVHVISALTRAANNGLAAKVKEPFRHKVACYYGCYLTRPLSTSSCKRAEDPQEMDDVMRAIGAEPIDWAFKVECCGAGLSVTRVDLVAELSGRIIDDAVQRGAEAIIVACPMCHSNLDLRRREIERNRGRRYSIPVLYVTQAVGLALGIDERTLGVHRHFVPVQLPETTCAARAVSAGEGVTPGTKEH